MNSIIGYVRNNTVTDDAGAKSYPMQWQSPNYTAGAENSDWLVGAD